MHCCYKNIYHYCCCNIYIWTIVVVESCPTFSLDGGSVRFRGSEARFSCSQLPVRILHGSNLATCNAEGHWTYTNGYPACVGKESYSNVISLKFRNIPICFNSRGHY